MTQGNVLLIGNVKVSPPVILAPMAGYTDPPFRSICMRFGCGMCFTEVVNAQGVVHGSRPTLHLLETVPGERPIAAHIYGSDPAAMAQAALIIEKMNRFDVIDVNCGCPVRKIVAKGAGAALMKKPEKIEAIVRAIRQAVTLPVTVKTRIGFSPDLANISEVAHAVEQGGGAAIFIHARFAANQHRGPADWMTLARIKSERSIPVVGNGGVSIAGDALRMIAETGVDGVMIGRAAVGNPWIFEEARCLFAGRPYAPHSPGQHRAIIREHLERLVSLKETERKYRRKGSLPAEQSAALHFRAHLVKYLSGFEGWSEIRRSLQTMNSVAGIMKAVDRVIDKQTWSRRSPPAVNSGQ